MDEVTHLQKNSTCDFSTPKSRISNEELFATLGKGKGYLLRHLFQHNEW